MAALTGDVPQLEGNLGVTGVSSRVQAAVPFYPPTDFLQMDAHMIDCPFFNRQFGLQNCHNDPLSPESRLVGCAIQTCPDVVARANPITYVSSERSEKWIAENVLNRFQWCLQTVRAARFMGLGPRVRPPGTSEVGPQASEGHRRI